MPALFRLKIQTILHAAYQRVSATERRVCAIVVWLAMTDKIYCICDYCAHSKYNALSQAAPPRSSQNYQPHCKENFADYFVYGEHIFCY